MQIANFVLRDHKHDSQLKSKKRFHQINTTANSLGTKVHYLYMLVKRTDRYGSKSTSSDNL